MSGKKSIVLEEFKKLIEHDYKTTLSKKFIKEIKNLLYWFVDNCPSSKGPEHSKKFNDYKCDFDKFKTLILDSLKISNNKLINVLIQFMN